MSPKKKPQLKITLVSPEVHPFSKTGGLGDVAGALPGALQKAGAEVTIVTPLYQGINPGDLRLLASAPFVIDKGERQVEFLEGSMPGNGARVIFINSPPEFHREGIYGTDKGSYPDNALRFGLFCQAAILAAHRWCDPDILHLHDWTTGLIPIYLRTGDRMGGGILERTKIVTTIHNLGYQGLFPPSVMEPLGIDPALFHWQGIEFYNQLSFLKAGITYSDLITTVSPSYAQEIQTTEFGCGLEGLLTERNHQLAGILNGVDYGEWNPENDQHIRSLFSTSRMHGKTTNKTELRNIFELDKSKGTPILATVIRLAEHKGVDLLIEAAERIIERGGQLIILGSGTPEYEEKITLLADHYPGRCGVKIGFDIPLSHKVIAGADMLLFPSRYEPCGLTHLYGMRYGAVPVVRATGGLKDTVTDVDAASPGCPATGFVFSAPTTTAFSATLDRAIDLYHSKKKAAGRTLWSALRRNCMLQDWSWDQIGPAYLKTFTDLMTGKEVIIDRPVEPVVEREKKNKNPNKQQPNSPKTKA